MPKELSRGFINIVDAINFLKHGVTDNMFNAYKNIKQYTHQIIENYPEFGFIYIMAVKKLRPNFKSDELGDKLKPKVEVFWKAYKAALKEGREDGQDRAYNPVLCIMYPELTEYLTLPQLRPSNSR